VPVVRILVLHDGAPSVPWTGEAVRVGLQDRAQEVHEGVRGADGVWRFAGELQVKEAAGGVVFSGPLAHGPPAQRFVYLSWKRVAGGAAPWLQRVKLPLGGITPAQVAAAGRAGAGLVIDATGRRPHATQPVVWQVGEAG
jgi:hypothetical protein